MALLAAMSACKGSDVQRTPAVAEHGGTLVISASGDPETLLPPLGATVAAKIIGDLVYDHLAILGDSMNTVGDAGFRPQLAKSWTWASDSLSITFDIDPAARWHDGRSVRASDVRFTWRTYSDSVNGSPYAASISSIDSVTVPDSLRATFWFSERSPMQFYDAVNAMAILPEHVLGDARGPALAASSLARAPVGSGRFRFVRWNAGASIEVAADTANYRGRPGFDRVIMTIAPDFNAALARLLGGEADLIEQVPPTSLADIAADSSLRLLLTPGLDYNFVQFNLRHPKNRSRPHPLFADVALRRALTAAVDRRSVVMNAYDSLAAVSVGPAVRALPTTDTTLRQIPYSPAEARRILDSLGWKDANGDGIRERNGAKLAFTLAVPGSSKARATMAVLIQNQLRSVGAEVNLEMLDFTAFIDRETRRDFDAVFGGWRVEASPGGIRQTWGSAGSRAGSGTNYGSYENAAFDALVDSALASRALPVRRAYFTKAYQAIIDDAPAIWMAEPKRVMAVHRRIRTTGVRPDAWWANIPDWSIAANERIARDRSTPAR
ncbi:MAG TPA: peptide ABC transporter substrate-binding protein [Gemmatimonadaceae bacterium]|nr:peptide ABC transporter substrate-binding protein [Gemmatimonadaceae bacterium]